MALRPPASEPLRTFPKQIDAACYNRVRLALSRLGRPLRIALPQHRGLDIVLDDDFWLVVDGAHDDRPVLAWLEFAHRSSLHEPVKCVLKLYHLHAGLIMGTALDALNRALAERLRPAPSDPN